MNTLHFGRQRKATGSRALLSAAGQWFETLEDRRLLSAFVADINFEGSNAPVPAGYVADNGVAYAHHANGLSYGWNSTKKVEMATRHPKTPSNGVNNLEDTFAFMYPTGTGSEWQIAVPNGAYQVSITAGDELQSSGTYAINVNGAGFLSGIVKPGAGRWLTASSEVVVTDGFVKLTVPKGKMAKIDYIDISQIVPPVTPVVPPVTPTPPPAKEAPFTGTPFSASQTIPFAEYDLGGQGISYNYYAAGNPGNDAFRAPDPVGISSGGSTGNVVTDTGGGEWLNYAIDVPTAGSYMLQASVANIDAGASFHAEVNGVNLTGPISVPGAAGWTTYATTTSTSFSLAAGVQVIRVVFDTTAPDGVVGNFDTFEIIPTPPVAPPVTIPASLGTLSWTQLANVPIPTIEGGSIGVNGKFYVFGGFYDIGDGEEGEEDDGVWRGTPTCQVFNPATNTWSYIAPLPDAETHEEVATDGTYIYVAGGNLYNPVNTYQTFATTEVWRYDIAANTWSAYVPLPEARGAGSMVLVGDELHFFGGVDVTRTPQTTHWELDIDSADPQWTLDTPAPVSRNHVATFSLNGLIYMMGGRSEGVDTGLPSNTAYCFNPATSTWTQLANLPNNWAVASYAVVDGFCVIMGGSNDAADPITSVIAYNPATNAWSTLTSFPTPKIGPNGGLVGNELIISGGDDNGPQNSTYGAFVNPET